MARSLPLFVCFVVAVIVFTGGFTASLWVSLNSAAVTSIDALSGRYHEAITRNLQAGFDNILGSMNLIVQGSVTNLDLLSSTVLQIQRYAYQALVLHGDAMYLSLAKADGETACAMRTLSGDVTVGYRSPSPLGTDRNTTYWYVQNNNTGFIFGKVSQSTVYDPRQRPWYYDTAAAKQTTVAPLYNSPDKNQVVSLSTPLLSPQGEVLGVLGVGYPFADFVAMLRSVYDDLRSSGMLVLLDKGGTPIAATTSSAATLDSDVAAAKAVMGAPTGNFTTKVVTLSTFGTSTVLQILIRQPGIVGLDWQLLVVLPSRDYYGLVWQQNLVVAVQTAVYVVVFVATMVLMVHGLITRPLRVLTQHLIQLTESLQVEDGTTFRVKCNSRFTEIRRLYSCVVDAVRTVDHMARIRSREAAEAAEVEAQSLVRAKDSFFAVMSHEMRTPLTACIGMAEILLETTVLDLKQQECAQAIATNGAQMLYLINDILDFSKMEADKLELEIIPYSPRHCVEQAA
eukprot:RCo017076